MMDSGSVRLESGERMLSIEGLLDFYVTSQKARLSKDMRAVQDTCNELFSRDYSIKTINNTDGSFCSSYPLDLIILEKPRTSEAREALNRIGDLKERFLQGRFARVRGRFPIPVILWRNKNICRSSTISIQAEVLLNMSRHKIRDKYNKMFAIQSNKNPDEEISFTVEAQRKYDAEILRDLRVKYICDLMVEKHKMKLGVVCSSSEKAEGTLYEKFHIQPMPYPGCEFFRDFKENKHCGRDLRFNWNCGYIDAKLATPPLKQLDLNWAEYKNWDIVVLTQNYFRLLMEYIADPSTQSGVLVHCISGWDRTPLFISLLRLSLWADGEIHQSLNAKEILFLTLGYDWMLFSHLLDDRLAKGEDIFYFCFYMLPFIVKREFSTIRENQEKQKGGKSKKDRRESESTQKAESELKLPSFEEDESNAYSKTPERDTLIDEMQENHFISEKTDTRACKGERTIIQGFNVSASLEDEFKSKGDLNGHSPPPENATPPTWGKLDESLANAENLSDRDDKNLRQFSLTQGQTSAAPKERGSFTRRQDSGIGESTSKPDSAKSCSKVPPSADGSLSEPEDVLHSKSKSINIVEFRRSMSHGRTSEPSEQKVTIGSWQIVSADLNTNSPSLSLSDNTPPLTGLTGLAGPARPEPPLLRKFIEPSNVPPPNQDRENSAFDTKISPTFSDIVERASKLESDLSDERQIVKAKAGNADRLEDGKIESSKNRDNVEKERSNSEMEPRRELCDTNIMNNQESGITIENSEKLRRREERLKMVHDLFMQAYREKILDSPGSIASEGVW
eukprot:CAMPEP_0184479946 /NCGR_PEP_ID=MMETSP0113_2-20130426/1465_1 /TAXON_ID=91329 /ORGANISM="Norrisiella sphaerica, Strain BC52" /LENGTH=790 /DNA_ID=CAMNT_0026858123 /DNA_START=88 /DNA_END=2457 /DNA_ORIENTATION=+